MVFFTDLGKIVFKSGKDKNEQETNVDRDILRTKNEKEEKALAKAKEAAETVRCPEIDFSAWGDYFTPPNFNTGYRYRAYYEAEEEKERKKYTRERLPTWNDFTRNTTFHGVKYIFDKRPYKLRRFLWFLVVFSCIGLFSYQVIDRTRIYFEFNSNVNVEIVYTDYVQFPTLTICNQNNYRISETVARGMYDFINIAYGDIIPSPYTIEEYDIHQNLTEFILATSHQKENFIDSCTWKGRQCNISTDFATTLTDFGVCYTFNGGQEQRNVTKSGSGFALGLILNVEQYEYMKGPQDEAGIKMLLHDPSEVPQVKDLGFAVAPGTHTLVAVKREEVISLDEPHGTCRHDVPLRSVCQSQCHAMEVARVCGCTDVYMPPVEGIDVCNITSAFTCVRNALASMNQEEKICNCMTPCNRVNYQPELSYAHLSKLSVDLISGNDPQKKEVVQKQFEDAREVFARVNKIIAEKDREMFKKVNTWTDEFENDILHSYQVLRDEEYLYKQYKMTNILVHTYTLMLKDFDNIKNDFSYKGSYSLNRHPDTANFVTLVREISHFLEFNMNGVSPFLIKLGECAGESNISNEDVPMPPISHNEYYLCEDSASGPYTFLYYKRRKAETLVGNAYKTMMDIIDMKTDFDWSLDYLFGNTSREVPKDKYDQCVKILDNMTQHWLPLIKTAKIDLETYAADGTNWIKKLEIFHSIHDFYNESLLNVSLTNPDNFQACNWFVHPNWTSITGKSPPYGLFLAHTESTGKAFLDASNMLSPLENEGKDLHALFRAKREPLFAMVNSFLIGNITKMEAYNHFASPSFKVDWEDLILTKERYMTDFKQFISKLSDIENNIFQTYFNAFDLAVPVLNDTVIKSLGLVKYSRLRQYDDKDFEKYLNMLTTDRENAIRGLISVLYTKYRCVMQEVQTQILQSFARLESAVNDVQFNLHEYADGNQLNEAFFMENFIKIDVFYKELSYEIIKQQRAFEFLSLVSEIGGFMGLLLGASILTMCELVDYLSLVLLRKCRAKPIITQTVKEQY